MKDWDPSSQMTVTFYIFSTHGVDISGGFKFNQETLISFFEQILCIYCCHRTQAQAIVQATCPMVTSFEATSVSPRLKTVD